MWLLHIIGSGESGIASPGHYTRDLNFSLGTSPNRKGVDKKHYMQTTQYYSWLLQITAGLKTKELMLVKNIRLS